MQPEDTGSDFAPDELDAVVSWIRSWDIPRLENLTVQNFVEHFSNTSVYVELLDVMGFYKPEPGVYTYENTSAALYGIFNSVSSPLLHDALIAIDTADVLSGRMQTILGLLSILYFHSVDDDEAMAETASVMATPRMSHARTFSSISTKLRSRSISLPTGHVLERTPSMTATVVGPTHPAGVGISTSVLQARCDRLEDDNRHLQGMLDSVIRAPQQDTSPAALSHTVAAYLYAFIDRFVHDQVAMDELQPLRSSLNDMLPDRVHISPEDVADALRNPDLIPTPGPAPTVEDASRFTSWRMHRLEKKVASLKGQLMVAVSDASYATKRAKAAESERRSLSKRLASLVLESDRHRQRAAELERRAQTKPVTRPASSQTDEDYEAMTSPMRSMLMSGGSPPYHTGRGVPVVLADSDSDSDSDSDPITVAALTREVMMLREDLHRHYCVEQGRAGFTIAQLVDKHATDDDGAKATVESGSAKPMADGVARVEQDCSTSDSEGYVGKGDWLCTGMEESVVDLVECGGDIGDSRCVAM
ncbi:hypothetical protein J8273_2139 [Carpediemonas membranifera]|uniref:Uncharacterized protein n=1 Tax=Carpediemonas membranifera TaxID=201153 RepID=A0A8J6B613_9EUKA|nr:hypothetical protein J8273_2139 [Carpediemonas membranifera]|eukprot:KAG9396408.1 hypothetical protein J8273_2139 [Carpediemonas membranifera]